MKKKVHYAFLLSFLLGMGMMFQLPLKAQILIGLGYQQGFYNMESANTPVDLFNDRGFLFKTMGKLHWPGGEIYAASIRPERWLLELTLNTRRARSSAESFSGNILNRRDVRFSMQAFSFGFGYAISDEEDMAVYLCGEFDFGYMRLLTRLAQKEFIGRANYQLWARSGHYAVGTNLRFVFRQNRESITVFSISPYFQYALKTFDFRPLYQILLEPSQWPSGTDPFLGRPINFGLRLNFDLDLLRFLQ